MRLTVLMLLTGAALSLTACATPAPPAMLNEASSGSPRPAPGYDWFLNLDGEEARLAYGLAESDDLRIGLDCGRGTGKLMLNASGQEGARDIFLESGGETERFAAKAEPSEIHDGVFLTAEARADAPVFQRFRRVGWLAVWTGDQRQAYAPHPESADGIERFFAFCG